MSRLTNRLTVAARLHTLSTTLTTTLSLVAVVLARPLAAQAFDAPPADAPVVEAPTLPVLRTLDGFLDRHPSIDDALGDDIGVFSNRSWLSHHALAADFVTAHPEVVSALQQRPDFVLWREQQRALMLPETRHDLAALDKVLEHQPAFERQLEADPHVLDRADVVATVPDLATFLRKHPRVTAATLEKPYAALRAEDGEQRLDDRAQERHHGG